MQLKGHVTDLDTTKRIARVTFAEIDNATSYLIPYARHVSLEVNYYVVVLFFSSNMADGLIVGAF